MLMIYLDKRIKFFKAAGFSEVGLYSKTITKLSHLNYLQVSSYRMTLCCYNGVDDFQLFEPNGTNFYRAISIVTRPSHPTRRQPHTVYILFIEFVGKEKKSEYLILIFIMICQKQDRHVQQQ